MKKVNVNGLSEFDVNKADFVMLDKSITLALNLSWPLVMASTNYSINGKVDVFEIYGNGQMK